MRAPADDPSDVPVASPASSASGSEEPAQQRQYPHQPAARRRSLMRALGEFVTSGVSSPEPATAWNFSTMGGQAEGQDGPSDPESDLIENIARAMRNPPLMRRLASVGADHGEAGDALPSSAPPPPATPAEVAVAEPPGAVTPVSTPPAEDDLSRIKRRLAEAEESFTLPPQSAEWLGKARRERTRARLRNAVAWLATLAIGGAIIAATLAMLQP